jgi:hypothetical protein
MMTINLNVPKGWHELTQKQLRYLLFLLSEAYTATAIKTLCLFRWTSLRVLNYADDGILLQLNKTQFFINALQIAEAVSSLSWMDGLPKIPVRIESIGKHHALKADFQGVPFETFIVCENLYQGFLHTKNEDLLRQMAAHLYGSHRVRPNKAERVGVFYWFASLKDYLARSFPNFLQPAGRSTDSNLLGGTPNIGRRLQESMNAQIRALTKGDITKESTVLKMDTWRALTELDALAREYDEFNRKYKH